MDKSESLDHQDVSRENEKDLNHEMAAVYKSHKWHLKPIDVLLGS